MDITSSQNKIFKSILSLRENKTRKKEALFLCEGLREIKRALDCDYKLSQVCFCENLLTEDERRFLSTFSGAKKSSLSFSKNLFEKLLVRKNSGLLLIFEKKIFTDFLHLENPLYLILDGIEKPANLGAIFRTASAAGVTQVFLTNSKVDVYHPHVIRNSLASCFSIPFLEIEEERLHEKLLQKNIPVYASFLNKDSKDYSKENYSKACAFVLGSEDKGISKFWQENSQCKIIIPMTGPMDSLNVSAATAILLFEAKRQRT